MILDTKTIQRIKQIPIEQVLYTVKFRHIGDKLASRCIFHNEKKASFYVYLKTNSWFCFGGCHEGGDVIKLIQKLSDINFVDACNYLKKYL